MIHLAPLIQDLALILGAAGIATLLFKKLKQPVVLGYILAGLFIGPHFSIFPTVTDLPNIQIWAEIGVIFLLFGLGLEFSFKKLGKVGGAATITGLTEIIFMLAVGYLAGQFLGWSRTDSIFLGGILSISSTTIIIRAFEELNIKSQKFVGLVFGVLIVEDLVAILLLVLLSTMSIGQQFEGLEMLGSTLKLGFFLVIWFLAGIFFIPSFLRRAQKLLSEESLLIVSLSLCLLMVLLATEAGFSPALGAFIMGSILAETTYVEKIEHITKSVKDLFAAIFFVSVGMLLNPAVLLEYSGPILIITAATIFGKVFSTTLGAIASGQSLKTSIQSGLSLAQIGEFSFIIATLGLTLKVTSDFLYPIAVAVSAITTFTTPYMIKYSTPIYEYIQKRVPRKVNDALVRYSSGAETITSVSDWKKLVKSFAIHIALNVSLIMAIFLLFAKVISKIIFAKIIAGPVGIAITLILTLICTAPFFWALVGKRVSHGIYSKLWQNNKYRAPIIVLEAFRHVIGLFLLGLLLRQFFSTGVAFAIPLVMVVILISVFSKKLQSFYDSLERRFLENLNEKEIRESSKNPVIAPWDAHIAKYIVAPHSPAVGKTLLAIGVREKYGVTIALIERGDFKIKAPDGNENLYPYDRVSVIGTDEHLNKFKDLIEPSFQVSNQNDEAFSLQQIQVNKESPMLNQSIRSLGIRNKAKAVIVGVERKGKRILNPDASFVFEEGDIIWIAGDQNLLEKLR
jgi:monovalent cation:H+ antiporter-2, CPA2 family